MMPETKPSYFDAVLSTEYDECNIASSDACRLANALVKGSDFVRQGLFIVDDLAAMGGVGAADSSIACAVKSLTEINLATELTDQKTCMLALERSAEGIISNGVSSRPTLFAIINGDMALPIATFETRSGGQCSYVQLGQEMIEDNLVVTGNDSRTKHVEAIRGLLAGQDLSPGSSSLLGAFIADELQRYQAAAEALLGPSLTRLAESLFAAGTKTPRRVFVYDGETVPEAMSTIAAFDILEDDGDDARKITLGLGSKPAPAGANHKKKTHSPEAVHLFAFARDVAYDLASFSQDGVSMNIWGRDWHRPATAEEMKTLRTLITTDPRRFIAISVYKQDRAHWQRLLKKDLPQVRALFSTMREPDSSERHAFWPEQRQRAIATAEEIRVWRAIITSGSEDIPKAAGKQNTVLSQTPPGRRGLIRAIRDAVDRKILQAEAADKSAAAEPEPPRSYYHTLYRQAQRELRDAEYVQEYAALVERTYGASAIRRIAAETIGEHSPGLDEIFKTIGGLAAAGRLHRGTLKGQKVGKTITDVDVFVSIHQPYEHMYGIEVRGRPQSQPDFEPVVVFDELLLRTRPNNLGPDKVLDILHAIRSVLG